MSAISIEVPLKIICLHHRIARYFNMSKYVMLDTERYNNKIWPILKNEISTFFFAKIFFSFNDFHLSPFRFRRFNILRYLTKGRDEGKILSGASLQKKLYQ